MMTLALTAILFATTPLGNFFADRATEAREDFAVFKTHRLNFPDLQQKGKLVVDINRGFIEVEGHDGNDVLIEVLTPPRFQNAADEKSEFSTLFTPKYDLDLNGEDNSIKFDAYNQDYVLNLRIKVPYNTDLSLDAYRDGYIDARNVVGVIQSHSEHCDITLLDVAGSATARSRNGDLKVVLQDVAANARLDFESYNGSIDLSLPETVKASTAIASGASNCRTAFKIDPVAGADRPDSLLAKIKTNVDEYQFGTINGGGVPLRIECEKGQITIRKTGNGTNLHP